MKTLYFDCIAGVSGDMILGALIDAGLDVDWLRTELKKLPITGWVRRHQSGCPCRATTTRTSAARDREGDYGKWAYSQREDAGSEGGPCDR
jgi:uncharacterized protein (DUF111 family)